MEVGEFVGFFRLFGDGIGVCFYVTEANENFLYVDYSVFNEKKTWLR